MNGHESGEENENKLRLEHLRASTAAAFVGCMSGENGLGGRRMKQHGVGQPLFCAAALRIGCLDAKHLNGVSNDSLFDLKLSNERKLNFFRKPFYLAIEERIAREARRVVNLENDRAKRVVEENIVAKDL